MRLPRLWNINNFCDQQAQDENCMANLRKKAKTHQNEQMPIGGLISTQSFVFAESVSVVCFKIWAFGRKYSRDAINLNGKEMSHHPHVIALCCTASDIIDLLAASATCVRVHFAIKFQVGSMATMFVWPLENLQHTSCKLSLFLINSIRDICKNLWSILWRKKKWLFFQFWCSRTRQVADYRPKRWLLIASHGYFISNSIIIQKIIKWKKKIEYVKTDFVYWTEPQVETRLEWWTLYAHKCK